MPKRYITCFFESFINIYIYIYIYDITMTRRYMLFFASGAGIVSVVFQALLFSSFLLMHAAPTYHVAPCHYAPTLIDIIVPSDTHVLCQLRWESSNIVLCITPPSIPMLRLLVKSTQYDEMTFERSLNWIWRFDHMSKNNVLV